MKRRVRRLFSKRPLHPVSVRKRPVTMEEDPNIAQKVEEQRAWMKEHGIEDPLVQRRSPPSSNRRVTPKENQDHSGTHRGSRP